MSFTLLQKIGIQFIEHLYMIGISLLFSILISVPLGFFISTRKTAAKIVIAVASILMTVPSLALFGIMVVILAPMKMGLGMPPAILAIFLYSILPITRNTLTALDQVSDSMIEAAKGIGLSRSQILWKIKIPLSIPVIMAGVRNSVVLGVSVATYGALVSAGGLGESIFMGIRRSDLAMILIGTIVVSALGIFLNFLLMKLETALTPKGLKVSR